MKVARPCEDITITNCTFIKGYCGVAIGSDMPAEEWSAVVRKGLEEFSTHPRVLQRFAKGALARQDYIAENDEIVTLSGRARLCPYYFVVNDRVTLGGVLATHCPSDKKLLHGMRDAIISPAMAETETGKTRV